MSKEQSLIIGLVIAFGVGVLTGALAAHQSAPPPAQPTNYDPARAQCTDALKLQADETQHCYELMLRLRELEIKKDPPK